MLPPGYLIAISEPFVSSLFKNAAIKIKVLLDFQNVLNSIL